MVKLAEKERVLVIRLGSVGDVLRTFPAVSAFRSCYPDAKIDWVVEEVSANIVKSFPGIDKVIVLPRKRWVQMLKNISCYPQMFREMLDWVRTLRRRKYETVLDFHGILKSGIIGVLSGAKKRVGFKRGFCKEFNYLFTNLHVDPKNSRLNRVYKNLELVHKVGCDKPLPKVWLTPSSKDREKIEMFWESIQPVHSPVIAIQPSSSKDTDFKRWFPDRYAILCDALVENLGATLVFTWGPGGKHVVKEIQEKMFKPSHIACSTSLMELSALFQKCDMYVGGDTGPMHLACLSGLPAVVIYGPTDPLINAPYPHSLHRIVRVDLPCSPCRNKACTRLTCMKEITPELVFGEVVALWEEIRKNREKAGIALQKVVSQA